MKFDPTTEIENGIAHRIIQNTVKNTNGKVIFSSHAKGRMQERNYSPQDVQYILLNGKITGKEFNEKNRTWAYTLRGDDLEGDEGGVVTAIISEWTSIIITVLS